MAGAALGRRALLEGQRLYGVLQQRLGQHRGFGALAARAVPIVHLAFAVARPVQRIALGAKAALGPIEQALDAGSARIRARCFFLRGAHLRAPRAG
jgi:hypothetical protein